MDAMKRDHSQMVIGGTIYEDREGNPITQWVSQATEHTAEGYLRGLFDSRIQPNIWGRLIQREIFEPVHVPRQFNCGEDYLANALMILNSPELKITTEPSLVYHYLVYKESLTNTWGAEEFIPFTNELARLLRQFELEEAIMGTWSAFRIKKIWLPYLRRGGSTYLKDKDFVKELYNRYLEAARPSLTRSDMLELRLYPTNRHLGRFYTRSKKLLRQKKT
jgi:hypothetical protein